MQAKADRRPQARSTGRLAFYSGVRIAPRPDGFFVDPSNWKRLQLLLGAFADVTLVAVEAASSGDDWVALPPTINVVLAHADFNPPGTPPSVKRRLAAACGIAAVAWRHRGPARAAAAVGVVWLFEPVSLAGLLLAFALRRPLLAAVVGSPAESFTRRAARARSPLSRLAYRAAAPSTAALERLMARKAQLLLVAGEGHVDRMQKGVSFSTAVFSESDIRPGGRRQPLGSTVTWAYAGTLSYSKGVHVLIEALALARASGRDHRAVLVGGSDPAFPLDDLLARHGVAHAVTVLGRLPWTEALDAVGHADVFVFLSEHEGMPKAPLEAMAVGVPVVVTPTGAEQYVVDGVNGLLVPTGDAAACAAAVQRLVEDDDARTRLAAAGVRTATDHTFEASVRRVHEQVSTAFPALVGGTRWDRP
ncbi:MAG: hypothetical protein QOI20_65 [Acidimicrobiaceae bacterium]|nr:hypothetical protein [Acidimicrobiaceae bacterium]